jgi:hypothetical protein
MFEPNDMLDYITNEVKQEPVEEMPAWLASFFDDDEYDTFSK